MAFIQKQCQRLDCFPFRKCLSLKISRFKYRFLMIAERVDVLVKFRKSSANRQEHSAMFGNESFARSLVMFENSSGDLQPARVKEKGVSTLDS